jgi:hypothetical protein
MLKRSKNIELQILTQGEKPIAKNRNETEVLSLLSEGVDKKHDKSQHNDTIGIAKACCHYLMNGNDDKASAQREQNGIH